MGLFFVAVAHALVVAVMISAAHISGGHLNPAVTLGLLAGGHITVFRSILYWIDQLVASSAACYLLHYLSGGLVSVYSTHSLHASASRREFINHQINQNVIYYLISLFSLYMSLIL